METLVRLSHLFSAITYVSSGAVSLDSRLSIYVILSQIPTAPMAIIGSCSMATRVMIGTVLFIILICKTKFAA
jgi:hypothetical protein